MCIQCMHVLHVKAKKANEQLLINEFGKDLSISVVHIWKRTLLIEILLSFALLGSIYKVEFKNIFELERIIHNGTSFLIYIVEHTLILYLSVELCISQSPRLQQLEDGLLLSEQSD